MKIGCCINMVAQAPDGIGIERLEALAACGYDYVELPLANPSGRAYPQTFDGVDYRKFISSLQKAGYDSRISIEAYTDNFNTTAPEALATARDACGLG